MTYNELLKLVARPGAPKVRADSRCVGPGDVFVAVSGTTCDGHSFIPEAVEKGAAYIVCEKGKSNIVPPHRRITVIEVEDTTQAAAILAQAREGFPASRLVNLAVTGTNGKTTVAFLARRCIEQAGRKCGLVGTVVYDTGKATVQSSLTTPDCFDIARLQSEMVEAGCEFMVAEASSHALSQGRLAGIEFAAAAFTNLAGDHMDYHKTEQDYLSAKAALFEHLPADATAVLNSQSPHARQISERLPCGVKELWYGVDCDAELSAHIRSMDVSGTVFELCCGGRSAAVRTGLVGLYNVSNHLAAAGLCLAAGLELETIAAGLSSLSSIPGRLERVDGGGDFSVLVDYAHTDDALQNVLSTLRPLCSGRLTVVFGCGGDRDRTKRPRMAKVCQKLADRVIVTSDNPRTEQPDAIIAEIMEGFDDPRSEAILVEPDRKKAIEAAVEYAEKDDIILIAGKGHETYQIIGTEKKPFSDKAVAAQCLQKLRQGSLQ